jgi:hypothetical protein
VVCAGEGRRETHAKQVHFLGHFLGHSERGKTGNEMKLKVALRWCVHCVVMLKETRAKQVLFLGHSIESGASTMLCHLMRALLLWCGVEGMRVSCGGTLQHQMSAADPAVLLSVPRLAFSSQHVTCHPLYSFSCRVA